MYYFWCSRKHRYLIAIHTAQVFDARSYYVFDFFRSFVLLFTNVQRNEVCMEKNENRHYNCICDILAIELSYLSALLFFLLSYRFSARPEAFQAKYGFLVFLSFEEGNAVHSIPDCPSYEPKKKNIESMPAAPIPTQNNSRRLSAFCLDFDNVHSGSLQCEPSKSVCVRFRALQLGLCG